MNSHHHHPHVGAHHHGDSEHVERTSQQGSRALLLAVVFTGGYALVELLGGLWSGSLALLADAGHMVTDAAALLFALAANMVARRPASERHSYGLARAEVIAAFVNALAMLGIVVWLFIEGVERLRQPQPVNGGSVFVIASVGLVVNIVVAWVLAREGNNVNTRAALLHVLGDMLGSVAAIAAGVIIYFTGYFAIDPLLSMLVGGLILRSTIGVLRETTHVLLDSVPEDVDYQKVGQALAGIHGVRSVHDLHIWVMVPGRSALSAHVLVDDVVHWPAVLSHARTVLRERFDIDHVTLQPEWLRSDSPRRSVPIRSVS
ncbi:MAG TPA: cation diffusion facilitator family transporter [Burkholderiaceae bacterium]|nr:cation diffusion facilitator family transporter [Burkholderiaceae bacterium]